MMDDEADRDARYPLPGEEEDRHPLPRRERPDVAVADPEARSAVGRTQRRLHLPPRRADPEAAARSLTVPRGLDSRDVASALEANDEAGVAILVVPPEGVSLAHDRARPAEHRPDVLLRHAEAHAGDALLDDDAAGGRRSRSEQRRSRRSADEKATTPARHAATVAAVPAAPTAGAR
jgi:hypothetical protein